MGNKELMDIIEIVNRISYFRNEANLSARELSLRIGKSDTYINHLESSKFNIKMNVVLDILEALDVSCEKFFSKNFRNYDQDIELFDLIQRLPEDRKKSFIDLMKHTKA